MPNLLPPTEELQQRDITCREMMLRHQSIVEADRSFEAVVATETPAFVFDWRNFEVIQEVLRADGGKFPESIVLLNDHMRHGVESVIGSATDFRRQGGEWVGRGVVGRAVEGNLQREQLWQDLKDGHIRAVSIGYVVRDYVDIPSGSKQRIAGKLYEAGERMLRVSTAWEVHELSLTPIGADSQALIRSAQAIREQPGDARPQKRSFFAR